MAKDINIRAGFARTFKGRSGRTAAQQVENLKAAKVRVIYEAPKETLDQAIVAHLRAPGDAIAISGGLRVLADFRIPIVEEAAKVRAKDGILIDVDTGKRSDRDGIEMLNEAVYFVNAKQRAPDPVKSAEHGAKGGRAKGVAAKRGRMSMAKARPIWRDKSLSIAEALEQMHGWTRETAYKYLKKRGVPSGPKVQS